MDPEPARRGDGSEDIVPIETRWVRERMRRAAEGFPPAGEAAAGGPESLLDRMQEAVDRIDATAGEVREAIRQKAWYYAFGSLTSAVIGIAAFAIGASVAVPLYQTIGVTIAILELGSVFVFRKLQKRLARDIIVVATLQGRYREEVEAARAPEEAERLAGRIRAELATALGDPLPAGAGGKDS
jgi:membrane protein implicated in regulation of membrane protease activity